MTSTSSEPSDSPRSPEPARPETDPSEPGEQVTEDLPGTESVPEEEEA